MDSELSVVTRLQGGRRRERGSKPDKSTNFTALQNVQTAPEDQPASCSVGMKGCLLRGKAAGACVVHAPPSSARINKE